MGKNDLVFEQITSQTVCQNKLSSRTKNPRDNNSKYKDSFLFWGLQNTYGRAFSVADSGEYTAVAHLIVENSLQHHSRGTCQKSFLWNLLEIALWSVGQGWLLQYQYPLTKSCGRAQCLRFLMHLFGTHTHVISSLHCNPNVLHSRLLFRSSLKGGNHPGDCR